jgi:hypothetical protein
MPVSWSRSTSRRTSQGTALEETLAWCLGWLTVPELGMGYVPLDANINPVRIQDKLTVVQ